MSVENVINQIYDLVLNSVPHVLDYAMNFTSGLFSLIIGIIISIYMFMGKERFLAQSRKVMYALFNEENAKFMIDLASESNAIFSGFITGKIIDAVVDKPSKLPQLRKFLNYYLPTTLKLLNAYDRMDAAGVSGSNIDGTKGKIEDIMGTICKAFDKQLDALYGEEALDISTDITVLENMLAQEGLGDTPFQSPGS